MSTQPKDLEYDGEAIVRAFEATEWTSPDQGWRAYLMLGGQRMRDAYRDWVTGEREPRASDYAFLAYSINRRLEQLGKEPMLPELPLPKTATPDPLRVIEGKRREPKTPSSLRSSAPTACYAAIADEQGKRAA